MSVDSATKFETCSIISSDKTLVHLYVRSYTISFCKRNTLPFLSVFVLRVSLLYFQEKKPWIPAYVPSYLGDLLYVSQKDLLIARDRGGAVVVYQLIEGVKLHHP